MSLQHFDFITGLLGIVGALYVVFNLYLAVKRGPPTRLDSILTAAFLTLLSAWLTRHFGQLDQVRSLWGMATFATTCLVWLIVLLAFRKAERESNPDIKHYYAARDKFECDYWQKHG
jgi:hypothetical protein